MLPSKLLNSEFLYLPQIFNTCFFVLLFLSHGKDPLAAFELFFLAQHMNLLPSDSTFCSKLFPALSTFKYACITSFFQNILNTN